MKFTIKRKDFFEAISVAHNVVDKKNVMPILANILIDAEMHAPFVKISATDLEVAVNLTVPAVVEVGGSITVSAKNLFDIIRESAGEEVLFHKSSGNLIEITSNASEYKIHGLDPKEYPNLPTLDGDLISLPADVVTNMFDKVSFAISSDETRYHLNGIFVEKSDTNTVMVATDGHRLSFVKKPIDISSARHDKMIIPRKGVAEIRRMISGEKKFDFCIGDRHVFIQNERQTLCVRLIDGNFPDYNRVIPKGNNNLIKIPKEALLGALRRVSLLSNETTKGVSFYFCKDSLTLTSTSHETGDAKEDLVINYSGDVFNIGFNARYFIDVLSVVSDSEVTIAFNSEIAPCLITCESDPGFCSVIMPMRV